MKHDNWQERTELLLGKERIKELKASHVLVVGLGGVGAYAAEMLCRAGIGSLTIIDADSVHSSNINRQLPALHSTIGQSKATLLETRLKDINPEVNIVALQEFLKDERTVELLDSNKFDFVVDAIDSVSPKVFLIYHSLTRKIPIISSLGAGGKIDLSKIEITDISKTYQCALAKIVRKRLKDLGIVKGLPVVFSSEPVSKESVILVEDEQNKKSSAGTISYLPAVFGCYLAQYVIMNIRK
jgi:tRNA A37 threonylcarbamoyladenosine dehydratase